MKKILIISMFVLLLFLVSCSKETMLDTDTSALDNLDANRGDILLPSDNYGVDNGLGSLDEIDKSLDTSELDSLDADLAILEDLDI